MDQPEINTHNHGHQPTKILVFGQIPPRPLPMHEFCTKCRGASKVENVTCEKCDGRGQYIVNK